MASLRRLSIPLILVGLGGCAALQQLAALRHVDFSLAGAHDGRLAGVSLARIAGYRDLSAAEVGQLAVAVANRELPLEFRLDVRAQNPAENRTAATLVRLAWTLLLDDRETIHGVVDTAWTIPAGQAVVLPLRMRLNLVEFFEGSAESLVNLAAGLAGVRADPARVTLRAVPTIETPLGPMSYPQPITIVSRTVGGAG